MPALLQVKSHSFEVCASHQALRVAFPAYCSHIFAFQEALGYFLLADCHMPELLDCRHVKPLLLSHLWKATIRTIRQYISRVKMKDFSLAGEVFIARVMQHMLHAMMQRTRQRIQDQDCPNNPQLHLPFTIITHGSAAKQRPFLQIKWLISAKRDSGAVIMRKSKPIAKLGKRELKEMAKGSMKGEKPKLPDIENVMKVLKEKAIDCSICQDTLVKPVTLSCQHSFCMHCFEEAALYSPLCSLCKQPIKIAETHINHSMQQLIMSTVPFMQPNERTQYLKRVNDAQKIEEKRLIDCSMLKPGDAIDYRDPSSLRWRKGSVMEVQKSDGYFLVYVELAEGHKQDEQDFQIFESHSRNLAKAGYFSSRSPAFLRVLKREKLIGEGMMNRLALSQHHKTLMSVLNPK